jgi:nitroreductase
MNTSLTKEQILEAYRYRHACKEFDPNRLIDDEDFEFILETGRLSPSSFGFEPWKFLVVQNLQLREKLREVSWGAQKQLPTASHYLVVLVRSAKEMASESSYIRSIMEDVQHSPSEVIVNRKKRYQDFLLNDFKLLENERIMFEWACRQSYIALGNMMTSAALIGIDSCPIEGFHKERIESVLSEAGHLDGDRFGVACMVAFGYRVQEPRTKTRRTANQVVEWVR